MTFKFKDVPALSIQAKRIIKKSKAKFEVYKKSTEETIFYQDLKPHGKKKIKRFDDRDYCWIVCILQFSSGFERDLFIYEKTQGYVTMIRSIV